MITVTPDTIPAWTKAGKSYPAKVIAGYWEADVYGVKCSRSCPLEAIAAACENWLAACGRELLQAGRSGVPHPQEAAGGGFDCGKLVGTCK